MTNNVKTSQVGVDYSLESDMLLITSSESTLVNDSEVEIISGLLQPLFQILGIPICIDNIIFGFEVPDMI